MKRRPPFGKAVPETCAEVWIYFGSHAWSYRETCRRWPGRLILPPDSNPSEFRWPVRRLEVLCVEGATDLSRSIARLKGPQVESEARILHLVAALRRDGASVVRVIHGEPPSLAVYRDMEVVHAAA